MSRGVPSDQGDAPRSTPYGCDMDARRRHRRCLRRAHSRSRDADDDAKHLRSRDAGRGVARDRINRRAARPRSARRRGLAPVDAPLMRIGPVAPFLGHLELG